MPSVDRAIRRQRMRPPRLAEAPHQRRVARPRGRSAPGSGRGIFRSCAEDLRERRQEARPRGRRRRSPTFAMSPPARSDSLASVGSSVDRQVVDAEVAEILERADRLRLARPGQPGQDDERAARLGGALAGGLGSQPGAFRRGVGPRAFVTARPRLDLVVFVLERPAAPARAAMRSSRSASSRAA